MDIKIFKHPPDNTDNPDETTEHSYFIYYPNYFNQLDCLKVRNYLDNIKDFRYNLNATNTDYARLQKWYQKDSKYFCSKWGEKLPWWESCQYDNTLLKIQEKVQFDIENMTELGCLLKQHNINIPNINSCLINKYRDGRDHIAPHCDTYHSFGKYPTICGISIGESRVFRVKSVINNHDKEGGLSKQDKVHQDWNFDYLLEDGSLFIMAGASQKYFSHEIIKSQSTECRYSLTFREFID